MAHVEPKSRLKKLRWNRQKIVLKWPIQGHLVHWQCCETAISLQFQNISIKKENSILIKHLLPIPPAQSKANTNLYVFLDYWLVLNCRGNVFIKKKKERKKYSKKWKSLVHLLPLKSHFPEIITKRYGGHRDTHSYSPSSNGTILCLRV